MIFTLAVLATLFIMGWTVAAIRWSLDRPGPESFRLVPPPTQEDRERWGPPWV